MISVTARMANELTLVESKQAFYLKDIDSLLDKLSQIITEKPAQGESDASVEIESNVKFVNQIIKKIKDDPKRNSPASYFDLTGITHEQKQLLKLISILEALPGIREAYHKQIEDAYRYLKTVGKNWIALEEAKLKQFAPIKIGDGLNLQKTVGDGNCGVDAAYSSLKALRVEVDEHLNLDAIRQEIAEKSSIYLNWEKNKSRETEDNLKSFIKATHKSFTEFASRLITILKKDKECNTLIATTKTLLDELEKMPVSIKSYEECFTIIEYDLLKQLVTKLVNINTDHINENFEASKLGLIKVKLTNLAQLKDLSEKQKTQLKELCTLVASTNVFNISDLNGIFTEEETVTPVIKQLIEETIKIDSAQYLDFASTHKELWFTESELKSYLAFYGFQHQEYLKATNGNTISKYIGLQGKEIFLYSNAPFDETIRNAASGTHWQYCSKTS